MNWFKKTKIDESKLGALEDPRSNIELKRDYRAEEIFSFAPINWVEKPESDWRKFPIFDQDGSSSCVAQTVAKTLGIENFLEEGKFVFYSPRDIYTRRKNFPSGGMWFQDGMKIGNEKGATIEQLMPGQGVSENEMNKSEDRTPLTEAIAKVGRGGSYISIPLDIDLIAAIIEPIGRAVLIGTKFGPNEWNKNVPTVIDGTVPDYRHAITATNAILYKGKKALVIEDSWGVKVGMAGRRIITEDWFIKNRITGAWYYKELKNIQDETLISKPIANFKNDLYYGLNNAREIKLLQSCLSYLKMFPVNIDYTGNYYGITLHAVKLFQMANRAAISVAVGYKINATGYFGKGSRAVMNKILA